MDTALNPIRSSKRIQSLDLLRGIAILGILVMNIQSYSMPGAAYLNPMAYGDLTGANWWVWVLSHTFADSKFISIFSILYGAGIVLVTDRVARKGGSPARIHYSRTLWLLVIGLLHAHLIWYGDILVAYAICALIAYLFRKKKPLTLMIVGIITVSVHTMLFLWFGSTIEYWPEESLAGALEGWAPSQQVISEEIAMVTGSLGEQISHNSAMAVMMETMVFLVIFFWRAGGLMLVGMALYKWGVLSASRSKAFYVRGALIGALIGLPLIIYGLVMHFETGWTMAYSQYAGSQYNYWGSLFLCYSYISIIMLLAKSSILQSLQTRLAAVGQMALTNYLMQSIICVFLFYGIGLSWFGELERWQQFLVVLGIWLLQILWSKPWLSRFRFGPFEWLWRSLTYRKKQEMKKTQPG